MDWKRAKAILISAFFILNIVLAVVLYNNLKVEEVSQQTIDNTTKILRNNKVHIEFPIPKYTGNDYMLQYEETPLHKDNTIHVLLGENYSQVDNNSYKSGSKSLHFTDDSGFEFVNNETSNVTNSYSDSDVDKYLKELSKKMGLPFNEFRLDGKYIPNTETGEGARVVYKGIYQKFAVFDNYIDVEYGSSGIKRIKYHYNKPISITIKKDIYVVPVYEILITKMTKYPDTTIINVDMGFKGKINNETKNLYESLSWRILTNSGKEFYFSARSGDEFK